MTCASAPAQWLALVSAMFFAYRAWPQESLFPYGGAAGWITLDIHDVPMIANTDYTAVVSTGGGGRITLFLQKRSAVENGVGFHR